MKNTAKAYFAAVLVAIAASCQALPMEEPQEYTYRFAATAENGAAKVTLGEGDIITWADGDEVGTFAPMTANFPSTVTAGNPPVLTARLSHPVNVGEEFCFYYPWYANAGDDAPTATIKIPSVQDGGIGAMPMCTAPYTATTGFVNGDEIPLLQFYNAGSVIEFKVWADEAFRTEKLRRIVLDASASICGTAVLNLAEVDGNDRSTVCAEGYDNDELVVDFRTPLSLAGSSAAAEPLYAVVAPCTCSLGVRVVTDAAEYSFTIPEKEFKRSGMRTFILHLTADKREEMSDAFQLITSLDDLEDGEYIIAGLIDGTYYGLPKGMTVSSGKVTGSALNVNSGSISREDGEAYAVTLSHGTKGWTINNGTNRLVGVTGNADLKTVLVSATASNDSYWTVSAGKNGTFRFTNCGTTSRGLVFRKLSSSYVFAHYATSNISSGGEYHDLELFKSGGSVQLTEYGHTEVTLPAPTLSVNSATVRDDEIILTWTANQNAGAGYRCFVDGFEPFTVFPDDDGRCTLQLEGLLEQTAYTISIYAIAHETEDDNVTAVYRQSETASITLTTKAFVDHSSDEWMLLDDITDLEAGSRIVFASRYDNKVNGDISNKVMVPVDVTFDDDFRTIPELPEAAVPMTVGGSTDAWTLSNEDGDILKVTSEKNLIWGGSSGTSTWKISVAADGKATVKSTTTSYGTFRYNTGAPRFTTYKNDLGNSEIYIFHNGSPAPSGPVQIQMTDISCAARGQTFITFEWSKASHATSYGVKFDGGTEKMQTATNAYYSGLAAGSTHTISVRAYGSSEHYLTSEWVTFSATTLAEGGSVQTGGACRGWFELPAQKDDDHDGIDDDNSDLYYSWTMRADAPMIRNFSCCYSKSKIHPVWVAAPFHSCYKGGSGRNESYKNDPAIGCDQSSKYTGYTRGHMVGSSDRTVSVPTNRQAFYYSNIGAQLSNGFNTGGGAWNNLESYVDDKWCSDTLYMVNGCIFESFTDRYGTTVSAKKGTNGAGNAFQVPTAYYKVLLRTKSGNTHKRVDQCTSDELMCVAFILTHRANASHKPSRNDMYSVTEVEQLTGLDFFVNVPNAPKSTYSASDWGL